MSAVGARAASHSPYSALLDPLLFQDVWELAFSVSYDHGGRGGIPQLHCPSKREVSTWAG